MKNLLMTTIAIFGLALISNAQVPNYVPSNGIVGWWPFNGNANDESGNGNNGVSNNIVYGSDRFNNSNSTLDIAGQSNRIITINNPTNINSNVKTFSVWIKFPTTLTSGLWYNEIILAEPLPNDGNACYLQILGNNPSYISANSIYKFAYSACSAPNPPQLNTNSWEHIVCIADMNNMVFKYYLNGELTSQENIACTQNLTSWNTIKFGNNLTDPNAVFAGSIDDIGIWNRALTQEEITSLFNAPNCSNNLTISPASNLLQIGSTAYFTATTSDSNPSYVWQSDLGQGFQTLNNYGNYSGVNTSSLSISNVQLPNHTQPIRVISTSGECIDTSNVATINITDTCIVTINDTITTLISVTDTLVINTLITGLTPPNNSNTIKVFPNPANSHITIDFGNFESMNGYTLTITNSIGQTVYTTPINEQSSYVDLSTWSGNGIYFVQIIDTQNNTIENRKIVLQ